MEKGNYSDNELINAKKHSNRWTDGEGFSQSENSKGRNRSYKTRSDNIKMRWDNY